MARETLKDFLNKRGSTADSISYIREESKNGLGIDPNTGDELLDLLNENSGLLGDYLSFLTKEENNAFQIKPGNSEGTSLKRGDSLDIADSQGAEKVFIEQGTNLKNHLNEYSNSGYITNAGGDLSRIVEKTGSPNNHNILKDIEGKPLDKSGKTLSDPEGDASSVVQEINKVFLKNNRFSNVGNNSKNAFAELPVNSQNFDSGLKLNVQNEFGSHNKDENLVTFNDLKEIGKSLLLSTSGFTENLDKGSNLASGNTGFNPLDIDELRAKNAKGFPSKNDASVRDGRGDYFTKDPEAKNSKSYGSSYNTEMYLQGKGLDLLNIEAIASMYALKKISSDFFDSFLEKLRIQDRNSLEADAESVVTKNASVDVGTYMLGKSRYTSSVKISNEILSNLLTNTIYPYGDAVDRGLEIIFSRELNNLPISPRAGSFKTTNKDKNIVQSAGFWLAVSRSILKSFDQIVSKYSDESFGVRDENQLFLIYKDIIDSNKFIQFYNTMAAIGDISLSATDGEKIDIPIPGNTLEGNKRSADKLGSGKQWAAGMGRYPRGEGRYKSELSWNQDASPSMYILPANVIRAATKLNNLYEGPNPARGMLGSSLVDKTYFGLDVDGSYNRIPKEIVKSLEDDLEAEYVPFYMQDLRTNEIISFNAFLTDLTDNITSNHNGVAGYGRLDEVKIYNSTKRSINLGFILMATNREDFDSMWYKINKLTTMLYPQWTPGSMVSTDGVSKFYQPFSQVIGASPIIRLRIGDIVKSNYSRFALARTFGIGDASVKANPSLESGGSTSIAGAIGSISDGQVGNVLNLVQDVALKLWLAVFGSPMSIGDLIFNSIPMPKSNFKRIVKNLGRDVALKALSGFLINGFANPLAVDNIIRQLRDPDHNWERSSKLGKTRERANQVISDISSQFSETGLSDGLSIFSSDDNKSVGLLKMMILKPNTNNGYFSPDTKKTYLIPRRLNVRVVDSGFGLEGMSNNKRGYKVKVVDINAPQELFGKHLNVVHPDILPNPSALFSSSIMGLTLYATDPVGSIGDALTSVFDDAVLSMGLPSESIDAISTLLYASNTSLFMEPGINPFTRAYETTAGRGLAGVMNGINFNWMDYPWETDFNARAPMGCKISFTFDVIHDIPPGLDHSGYNRAPLYNVGEIMKNISGDPYSDNGKGAEFSFKRGKPTRLKIGRK